MYCTICNLERASESEQYAQGYSYYGQEYKAEEAHVDADNFHVDLLKVRTQKYLHKMLRRLPVNTSSHTPTITNISSRSFYAGFAID